MGGDDNSVLLKMIASEAAQILDAVARDPDRGWNSEVGMKVTIVEAQKQSGEVNLSTP